MYNLRPPQVKVLDKLRDHINKGRKKVLIFAPTGFGKTILSYQIIKNAISRGNSVLFTSHRITLAEQSALKFADLDPGYIQGSLKQYEEDYKLIVATLQTLINVEIKPPKIVIIDECHYGYESNMIQSLFDKFPDAIFVGLSATPVDDSGYLLDGFDAIVDDFQTKDLIDLGWLTPFSIYSPMSVDVSSVKMKGADYDPESLSEVINKPDINQSIVDNYIKHSEMRKFICFGANTTHCLDLKEKFTEAGINTAVIIATTKKKERSKILQQFADGTLKGLISIEILTAGFDDPTVGCVVLATVTKSWRKYVQECGRGIRLNGQSIEESIKNGKADCILIDCAGNIAEHGLPDDRKNLIFRKKISRVIDRELQLDIDIEQRSQITTISEEKLVYLKKIGSLLDLYEGKHYRVEAELQEDVNNYLDKTGYFWWRQNSGKMYKDGRWIHFASKAGLPDCTVFYNQTSIFFGLELKLSHGRLTDHQKKTLPEMAQRGVLFFIAESVYDVYRSIEHIEKNTAVSPYGTFLSDSVYTLPDWQIDLRNRLKIPLYDNRQSNRS